VKSTNNHWDTIFKDANESKLGWYESDLTPTLKLLDNIEDWKKSSIFISGAGTSTLVDELLKYDTKLILNDISYEALELLKTRLQDENVCFLCQDIASEIDINVPKVDIWIDRAVLHFLTEDRDIKGYFKNLKSKLKDGGYVMFAEFSKTGATSCAGLPVKQYSLEEFEYELGSSFSLVSSFEHLYINPNGDKRPYIYALYIKK